jgi:hypothetical protein
MAELTLDQLLGSGGLSEGFQMLQGAEPQERRAVLGDMFQKAVPFISPPGVPEAMAGRDMSMRDLMLGGIFGALGGKRPFQGARKANLFGGKSLREVGLDGAISKQTGRPFWAAVVDRRDGKILQEIPFSKAQASDFHHSFYVDSRHLSPLSKGDAELVFFRSDGIIDISVKAPSDLHPLVKQRILEQVSPAGDFKSFTFQAPR